MSPSHPVDAGVQLPRETSASALLPRLLRQSQREVEDLAGVEIPEDPDPFRKSFPRILPAFELARIVGGHRSQIARSMARAAAAALVYRDPDGTDRNLREHLDERQDPPWCLQPWPGAQTPEPCIIAHPGQTCSRNLAPSSPLSKPSPTEIRCTWECSLLPRVGAASGGWRPA